MEQSPFSEAKSHSANQEIPHLLYYLEVVHYCVHKSPTLVCVLSQMYSVHTFPPYFSMMYSDIIFLFTPGSFMWSLIFRFSNQNGVCISYLSHAHLILHDMITLIIFGETYEL